MIGSEADDLVEDLDRAVVHIAGEDGKRTSENMILHSRNLHVNELAGLDARRDLRRFERHHVQSRAYANVSEYERVLVDKRHDCPPLSRACLRKRVIR